MNPSSSWLTVSDTFYLENNQPKNILIVFWGWKYKKKCFTFTMFLVSGVNGKASDSNVVHRAPMLHCDIQFREISLRWSPKKLPVMKKGLWFWVIQTNPQGDTLKRDLKTDPPHTFSWWDPKFQYLHAEPWGFFVQRASLPSIARRTTYLCRNHKFYAVLMRTLYSRNQESLEPCGFFSDILKRTPKLGAGTATACLGYVQGLHCMRRHCVENLRLKNIFPQTNHPDTLKPAGNFIKGCRHKSTSAATFGVQ